LCCTGFEEQDDEKGKFGDFEDDGGDAASTMGLSAREVALMRETREALSAAFVGTTAPKTVTTTEALDMAQVEAEVAKLPPLVRQSKGVLPQRLSEVLVASLRLEDDEADAAADEAESLAEDYSTPETPKHEHRHLADEDEDDDGDDDDDDLAFVSVPGDSDFISTPLASSSSSSTFQEEARATPPHEPDDSTWDFLDAVATKPTTDGVRSIFIYSLNEEDS
jgi:hypothetical protein